MLKLPFSVRSLSALLSRRKSELVRNRVLRNLGEIVGGEGATLLLALVDGLLRVAGLVADDVVLGVLAHRLFSFS